MRPWPLVLIVVCVIAIRLCDCQNLRAQSAKQFALDVLTERSASRAVKKALCSGFAVNPLTSFVGAACFADGPIAKKAIDFVRKRLHGSVIVDVLKKTQDLQRKAESFFDKKVDRAKHKLLKFGKKVTKLVDEAATDFLQGVEKLDTKVESGVKKATNSVAQLTKKAGKQIKKAAANVAKKAKKANKNIKKAANKVKKGLKKACKKLHLC